MSSGPEVVICCFRVKAGCEAAFEKLLDAHWPILMAEGLVTDRPAQHFKSARPAANGGYDYYHIMEWKAADSSAKAHESDAVKAIWYPMGDLCEERDGRPSMEFPHVLELKF